MPQRITNRWFLKVPNKIQADKRQQKKQATHGDQDTKKMSATLRRREEAMNTVNCTAEGTPTYQSTTGGEAAGKSKQARRKSGKRDQSAWLRAERKRGGQRLEHQKRVRLSSKKGGRETVSLSKDQWRREKEKVQKGTEEKRKKKGTFPPRKMGTCRKREEMEKEPSS